VVYFSIFAHRSRVQTRCSIGHRISPIDVARKTKGRAAVGKAVKTLGSGYLARPLLNRRTVSGTGTVWKMPPELADEVVAEFGEESRLSSSCVVRSQNVLRTCSGSR